MLAASLYCAEYLVNKPQTNNNAWVSTLNSSTATIRRIIPLPILMTLPQDIHQVMKQTISMEQSPSENTHSKGPDAAANAATANAKRTRRGRQKSNRKALKIYRMKAFLEELKSV